MSDEQPEGVVPQQEISEQPVSQEAEQEEVKIDKISCESIKSAFTSKQDEADYYNELKTMYDSPDVHAILDELIAGCKQQEEMLKNLKSMACPLG